MIVAACGRQVTGLNAPGGGSIASGTMLIRVNVAGTLDFTNYQYLIVFNTSGSGAEPYPQAFINGFQNFSYALDFSGPTGAAGIANPTYTLLQYYENPTTPGLQAYRPPGIPPQDVQFVPNVTGAGSEFQVAFNRLILNQPPVVKTGSPAASASPATTALPSPAASGSPTATSTPFPLQTTPAQQTWSINFIVTDANGSPVDSMGTGGASDTSYSLQVDTARAVTINYTKPAGAVAPANPNEQLTGFTLINAP